MLYNISNHPTFNVERKLRMTNLYIMFGKQQIITEFEVFLPTPISGVTSYIRQLIVVNDTKVNAQGIELQPTGYDEETKQPIYAETVYGEFDFFLALFTQNIKLSEIIQNAVTIADGKGRFN